MSAVEVANVSKTIDSLDSFAQMCRVTACDRLKYLSREDWDLKEADDWDRMVFASDLAMITVAGKDLKIFFKAHFRPKSISKTLPDLRTRVGDFFSEYANLFAGGVKQVLLDTGLVCGISLPTILSGFDEVIFSDKIRSHRLVDCFRLVKDSTEVYITISTDIMSGAVSDLMATCKVEADDDDDIEFL